MERKWIKKLARAQEHTNRFFSIRVDGNDKEVGAWAAKSPPSLLQAPELNSSKTYKLISVIGGHFHGIHHDVGFYHPIGPNKKVFNSQISKFFIGLVVENCNGQRIWPLENDR